MAKVYVQVWGSNKKVLIDTDPPGTSVIGENTYIRSPSGSGVLVPVVPSDVLNTGSAAAQAQTTVKADTRDKSGRNTPGTFSSPLTTKGDLWVFGPSNTRLPVGANGTVLTADSTSPFGVSYQTPGGASSPSIVITKTAHGFTNGQLVIFNGTTYLLAKADSATDAEVVGMVTNPITTNTFTLLAVGPVTLSGLTAGTYFLDTVTAGNMVQTDPNVSGSVGQVSKPLGFALSATQFFFMPMRGDILTSTATAVTGITVLSSTPNINLKTIANTILYTPSGKTAVVMGAFLKPTTATAITVGPTFGIGTNATPSNIFAQTALTSLTATGQAYNFTAPGVLVVAPSGTPILGGVTVAASGTAMVGTLDLIGYLY